MCLLSHAIGTDTRNNFTAETIQLLLRPSITELNFSHNFRINNEAIFKQVSH